MDSIEQTDAFTPTTAEDYPVVKDVELQLPSGARAIVRQPNLFGMMSRGRVPADLFTAMQGKNLEPEQIGRLMNILVAESFVTPRVSTVPKKGCVLVSDLPNGDYISVVQALGLKV